MHLRVDIATDTVIVNIVVGVQGTRVFFCAQFVAAKHLQLGIYCVQSVAAAIIEP